MYDVIKGRGTCEMACRKTEYDFLERPSQDFFCPVSLELLLEPQLTSCCGHHLSLEAVSRLGIGRKPCPMCNGRSWSTIHDKYHRRKVHELPVRCWHKKNGCDWVGELNELEKHGASCEYFLWRCRYCEVRCESVQAGERHLVTCPKFPEPCPNSCEVGSVERCNMEQHRSVCLLEPVPCEMKEFGCSVVVPRKELATHMKESELQHLTAMTMLNLRLTKQLQQDSTERDKKITQLQEDSAERDRKIAKMQEQMTELRKLHCEDNSEMKKEFMSLNMRFDEREESQSANHTILAEKMIQLEHNITEEIEKLYNKQPPTPLHESPTPLQEDATSQPETNLKTRNYRRPPTPLQEEVVTNDGASSDAANSDAASCTSQSEAKPGTYHSSFKLTDCDLYGYSGTENFIFGNYKSLKESGMNKLSAPFYTHYEGYKLRLRISYYDVPHNDIGARLQLMHGDYDDELDWPVKIRVRFEVLTRYAMNVM